MSWVDRISKIIHAFHSSPHDFDRFDLSKIGTGEGAQVYGHGLYFAENPEISGKGGHYYNQFSHRMMRDLGPEGQALYALKQAGGDRAQAVAATEAYIDRLNRWAGNEQASTPAGRVMAADDLAKVQARLDLLKSDKIIGPKTYEVNINADPNTFLDWDKRLSAQPKFVQSVLKDIVPKDNMPSFMQQFEQGTMPGRAAYWGLGEPAEASQALNEAGIPGISYFDANSRSTADLQRRLDVLQSSPNAEKYKSQIEGLQTQLSGLPPPTSNYVVFDPNIVDIMKKYSIPGLGLGALYEQGDYGNE